MFDLSCDIDVHAGSMSASGERAVAGVTSGRIGPGQQVTWRARHFGIVWQMTSVISAHQRPHRFVDEMVRGPIGRLLDGLVLRRHLRRLLERRNRHIKELAEGSSPT